MKLRIIFTALSLASLVGCMTLNLGTRYEYSYKLTKPDSANGMKWEDDKIAISFFVSDKEVDFTLRNKTNEVIKVNWDEATIVQYGKAGKVMHAGVKYTDRNESHPSTAVPPGASIDDLLLPSDNVYWREGYYGEYYSNPGGWEENDLFPTADFNKAEYKDAILKSKGKSFSIYLPIQYQNKTLDYTFEFVITDVQPISQGGH
ncbi:MAG TPA: hypothetical protein VLX91_02245 [Candidatus Acidoferrales bacterium]|nr:hypothetical protein [Candidatus Acidoferrales bacterium]